jgi:hypothetical protein
MLFDYGDYLEDNIPAKKPVGDCNGWLMHNKRRCACYEKERAELAEYRRRTRHLW